MDLTAAGRWEPLSSNFLSMEKREFNPKQFLRKAFNYKWLVTNFPFFIFLAALAVIYIYNGHYSTKTIRNISKESTLLKELQYEYKTLKSELMFETKQSEIIKKVENNGLAEMTSPPFIVRDSAILNN